MTTYQDANLACNQIHDFIQSSGLHFVINQTPYSSYITIRRKYVHPDTSRKVDNQIIVSDELKVLREKNNQLENKLTIKELELESAVEEHRKVMQENDKKFRNVHSLIEVLENKVENFELERLALDKENKRKDDIIKNLNAGFNTVVADLNNKVNELETFKNASIKKEKKAQKKLRQKAEKEIAKTELSKQTERSEGMEEDETKDDNENNRIPEVKDITWICPTTCLPALRMSVPFPASDCTPPDRPPSSPPSPHTPPGCPPHIPIGSDRDLQPEHRGALSCYFSESTGDLLQDSKATFSQVSEEYIRNISKLNLAPRTIKKAL